MTDTNPWFWAFLAAVGWLLGFVLITSRTFGRNPAFGVLCFLLAQVPRAVLPLPFVNQPRIDTGAWTLWTGIGILAVTLPFTLAAFQIVPWSAPDPKHPMRTDRFYAIVRHPLMFRDSFWPLGWSLIFGSVIGMALTPIWLGICWLLTILEEERLVEVHGLRYDQYRKTTSRLIPLIWFKD